MLKRYFWVIIALGVVATGCKSKRPTAYQKRKHHIERPVRTKTPVAKDTRKSPSTSNEEVYYSKATANIPYNERVALYIKEFKGIAQEEMVQYGIPASIKIAQGILESGAGMGELAVRSNNHFGIKCHTGWEGDRVYHNDDAEGECFRKYTHPKYSYRDHSLFLTERSRYRDLFSLKKDDYRGWARGLKKAGYATDPRYPEKVIGIIERYNLNQFDREVLGGTIEESTPAPDESKIATYTVQPGDTLYNISRRFNLTVDTLMKYNGLTDNTISIGQTLYLHPVEN